MRTPGRCLNFETCWVANGRRDIRVIVGDPFVCPACGERLHAPSIESISSNSILGAVAVSLALVATAGAAGFGVMRLVETTSFTQVADLLHPAGKQVLEKKLLAGSGPKLAVAALRPAPAMAPPPVPAQMAQAAPPTAPGWPAPAAEILQLAAVRLQGAPPVLRVQTLQAPAAVMVASNNTPPLPAGLAKDGASEPVALPVNVTWAGNRALEISKAAPAHPLVLPISFGRPNAPEDDTPARSPHWRHHGVHGQSSSFFLPVPGGVTSGAAGWSQEDDEAVLQAQDAAPPDQGDSSADRHAMIESSLEPEPAANTPEVADADAEVPGQDDLGGATAMGGAELPVQQPDTAVPAAPASRGLRMNSSTMPAQLAPLILPAVLGESQHEPAYLPAVRIDPALGAKLDAVPGAPARLVSMAAAKPDKLAVPAYPPAQEEADLPGRVDVGCTITPHGLPANCQVQRQEGGRSFAHSVLAWLNSGAVRYRPGLAAGQPVAEPRDYRVRFEP